MLKHTYCMQKFYRLPWSKEKVEYLKEWWPHFGSYIMADLLSITRKQIKAKVNKLKLKILPKSERLCFECKTDFQYSRCAGVRCKLCYLSRRKILRKNEQQLWSEEMLLERWIKRSVNTVNHRSESKSLTCEIMIDLWNKQSGLCYYSGLPMIPPRYGNGRVAFSPSIDRINSNGDYTKGNVVWCVWVCNAGKNNMSVSEYVFVCDAVSKKWRHGDVLVELVNALPEESNAGHVVNCLDISLHGCVGNGNGVPQFEVKESNDL